MAKSCRQRSAFRSPCSAWSGYLRLLCDGRADRCAEEKLMMCLDNKVYDSALPMDAIEELVKESDGDGRSGLDADLLEMLNSTLSRMKLMKRLAPYGDFRKTRLRLHQPSGENTFRAETPTYPVAPAPQPAPALLSPAWQPSRCWRCLHSRPQTAAPGRTATRSSTDASVARRRW